MQNEEATIISNKLKETRETETKIKALTEQINNSKRPLKDSLKAEKKNLEKINNVAKKDAKDKLKIFEKNNNNLMQNVNLAIAKGSVITPTDEKNIIDSSVRHIELTPVSYLGWDHYNIPSLQENYEKYTLKEKDYYVDFISAQVGGSVKFKTDAKPEDSVFISVSTSSEKFNTDSFEVKVSGVEEIEVLVKKKVKLGAGKSQDVVVGKAIVVGYNEKKVDIVLVGVNGGKIPSGMDEYLNNIYGQANAKINLEKIDNLEVAGLDSTFVNDDHQAFSKYSESMKKVIFALKKLNEYNKDKFYIFYLPSETKYSNNEIKGFMSVSQKFGFMFTEDKRTLAHEIGHGVFSLNRRFK